jgi:hypothetical protein
MQYVAFRGVYADVPVGEIVAAWKKAYGEDHVNFWIKGLEAIEGRSLSDFEREEVLEE